MFYLATIITMRIIMLISAQIVSNDGGYSEIQYCGQIDFALAKNNRTAAMFYPECGSPDATKMTEVVVKADMKNALGSHSFAAAFGVSFGVAMWVAIMLHLVGVELYLGLTPRETARLRKVSYEKQLEAGFRNPGSSGLTSDRWGDAEEYKPFKSNGEGSLVPSDSN